MWGCHRDAAMSASRAKRCRYSGSALTLAGRIFSASCGATADAARDRPRPAAGSATVVLRVLPRVAPDRPIRSAAARRCSAPPQSLAVKRQPHLAGTVDPVVGGVDSRDLGLEG